MMTLNNIHLPNGRTFWAAAGFAAGLATLWLLRAPLLHASGDQPTAPAFLENARQWENDAARNFHAAGGGTPSKAQDASPLDPATGWDQQVLDQMEKMQREMDREFNDSVRALQQEPGFKGFFDEPRLDSSIDMGEQGGNYVVKAYLPDRDLQNVSVSVANDTLKIEAKAQDTKDPGNNGPKIIQEAQYSQAVTLPGPVNAGKMKIDKKEGMLVITLPKADSK